MVFNTFSSKQKGNTNTSVSDRCARAKGLEKENRRNWRLVYRNKKVRQIRKECLKDNLFWYRALLFSWTLLVGKLNKKTL